MDDYVFKQNILATYQMEKRIIFKTGDICEEKADILVCSAFIGSHKAVEHTLIGALKDRDIDVEDLYENREREYDITDESAVRCWISKELSDKPFSRIACIELRSTDILSDMTGGQDIDSQTDLLVRILPMFGDMINRICEKIKKGSVRRICMTIPGIGKQKMEPEYVIPPLLSECDRILRNNQGLEEILIYEKNIDKAHELKKIFENCLIRTNKLVFISYSSKDSALADEVFRILENSGIKCWKAPESIPAGSNYQQEIPRGISNTGIMVVIMSENLEQSRWCYKEIGSAIGARCMVLPVKFDNYRSSDQFNFLMDGEQIFPAYEYAREEALSKIVKIVTRRINLKMA